MLRKEPSPTPGNGWHTFTCGDEEKNAMDLHHSSSLSVQSYRQGHAQHAFKASLEEGWAASC